MTHQSTATAKHRENDRNRQQRRRKRMKALGIPMPHQCDNAIAEAVAFSLAMALVGKNGVRAQTHAQTISFNLVFTTAHEILFKRWRFDKAQSATALKARLALRPEHKNPSWTPHLPSCEPACWADMSTSDSASTPVTPSGHVTPDRHQVTQI